MPLIYYNKIEYTVKYYKMQNNRKFIKAVFLVKVLLDQIRYTVQIQKTPIISSKCLKQFFN